MPKHTATICYHLTIDIDKLIKLSKGKKIEKRTVKQLEADRLDRTSDTGFSRKRYKQCNIKYPILISLNDVVLDGRHRLCKLFDSGINWVNVIVMSDTEIESCSIGNNGSSCS